MSKIWTALALPLALSACMYVPVPVPTPAPGPAPAPEDTCGAQGFQNLIGRKVDVLNAMFIPHPTRILRPGMMTTMEFSPERVSFTVDGADIILEVSCG